MKALFSTLLIPLTFLLANPALSLTDQGLSSVLSIIDRATEEYQSKLGEAGTETGEESADVTAAATTTVVNLSRTLGKLSYSRLQCGQAEVLAEFTRRVQALPEDFRDPMRDAFQEGFDQSKAETPLLSEDECARLTQSRTRGDKKEEALVKDAEAPAAAEEVAEPEPEPEEDPNLRHFRVAELSGQLAYRRKFCGDNRVVTRDFNEVIGAMPEEIQDAAKEAYWKGYKRGKRLNKGLTQARCN